jgi:phospholipid/cholesterol/gamma-HCH transport system permease protein
MTITNEGPPQTGEPALAPKARGGIIRRLGVRDSATGALAQAGDMAALLAEVVVSAVRNPIGYWGAVREQLYEILRYCWLPMLVSCVAFGMGAPGLQGGNIMILFGMPERLGAFFLMASVREFAPWINAMIVAGVIGTSITADLGARRIREEFDALQVLGVDPVREVILPRVIAVTLMTGLMDVVAMVFGVIGGWLAALELGSSSAAFFNNFWSNATTVDLAGSVTKTFLFGLIVGTVCAYKGYRAQGGPMGVGRAVNQAVVIAFAAIYSVNFCFTALLLGLNPSMMVYR